MTLLIGKRSRRKNSGFTFIELILVAIIILVLIGVTVPQFRGPFHRIQFKNTCQNLIQLMRYVQAEAIAQRKLCRVNFDFEQSSFWATAEDDAGSGKFATIKGRWGKTFKAPEGTLFKLTPIGSEAGNEETPYITFYPDGSSDKTEIKISDAEGETFKVCTKNRVGYVEVEE